MSRSSVGRRSVVSERVEVARYTVSAGTRLLYAQRIDRLLCVTDRPASGTGRSYLVEYGMDPRGVSALQALAADYTRQAADQGAQLVVFPEAAMCRFGVPLARSHRHPVLP